MGSVKLVKQINLIQILKNSVVVFIKHENINAFLNFFFFIVTYFNH
jgi:hypothetical protein